MNNFKTRSQQAISPVIGRFTEIQISHGEGCMLYDTTGKAYLDFSSGIAVTSTGHCHPDIVAAINTQSKTLIHPCIGVGYYDIVISLAEKLVSFLDPTPYSVFFSQTGSDAMEAAIKLAVYVQKKHQIVAFKGGFHGRTLGALSITTSKQKYRDGYDPLLYPVEFLDFPHTLHSKKSLGQMIDDINTTPVLNKNVAAVIIEPILGEGGYYIAPAEYLQALQTRCQSLGILLIIDEVQTGIARTGSWFYFQQLGLTPDIITLAKGLGSGMPIGACMAKKEIMDQWRPGAHGGTYGGNPVSCAAALATLSVLENYLESVKTLGRWALAMLQDTIGSHPVVGEIRGVGLMIGIEFVNDKNQPNPDAMKRVIDYCLDHHLIVISCGIYDNVIRIIPPLIIDQSLLNQGLSVVIDGVRACDH